MKQQVVKVIWHKTASRPQTDGSVVLAWWRQCAFPCRHNGATWRIRLHLSFLRCTRVHNPNGKWIGSAVLTQLLAESPYTYNGLFFPQNCPFRWGIQTPSNTWFPGPIRVLNPNSILIGSAIFAGLTSVTDRLTVTDHATRSVTIDRIYVRSTGDAV